MARLLRAAGGARTRRAGGHGSGRGGAVRGQRDRGAAGDAVEPRRLPGGLRGGAVRLRSRQDRCPRVRDHPPGGRDRDRADHGHAGPGSRGNDLEGPAPAGASRRAGRAAALGPAARAGRGRGVAERRRACRRRRARRKDEAGGACARRPTFTQSCQGWYDGCLAERDYIEAVRSRVVVFDGGMGATLEQFDLTSEDYGGLPGKCHEALVLNRPDVVQGVHESMLEAGAEVLETDTFQASRIKLDEWGLGEHTLEINRRAAEIARKAVGEGRFVAGSIGPTGHLPASEDPSLGQIRFRELVEVFTEQSRGLLEGGVDLLIVETAQDILEVKAAIFGMREAFKLTGRKVPIQASVTLLPNGGKMLLGTDINAALTTLEALKVDVIGLNCSTGPEDMRDAIRFLGEHSPLPVHCIPNAGLPHQGPDGETVFPEQPGPLADVLGDFVERYGVSIVGGCCGTTPDHIRAIKERCASHPVS